MSKPSSSSTLVYSTETGRMCPGCRQALVACVCKANARTTTAGDGVVRVSLQTKGRGGKSVTLVKGLTLDVPALTALGKQLRAACGSGGTTKDGIIEIQGDHCVLVLATLAKLGHAAKRAGG